MFWKMHARAAKRPDGFPEAFMNLFLRMVAFEPSERITMQQIQQHEWFLEPTATYQDAYEEM